MARSMAGFTAIIAVRKRKYLAPGLLTKEMHD
jgi:hypothetical protein